ncbi:MAG: hypothetical protein HY902_10080 [Deltaproteobacteria bacterium]|nr:hypothetical protein [Deltaproteobacteria bacterium]
MLGEMAQVLYIHPYNHAIPDAIPVGAVGAINALRQPVLGRYAEELSDDDLADAKVALLDAHWFLATAALGPMIAELRRRRPGLQVVCGGLTASFYKQAFLDQFDVDFLVAGDVEDALPDLIDTLVRGELAPDLPNVWSRRGPPQRRASTSRADFNALDWLSLDWFPSYRARVERTHAAYRQRGEPVLADNCHPILPLSRGCRRSCGFCYGGYQDEVFGPRVRMRSPATLCRDLERIEADPALHFVSLYFADAIYAQAYAPALAGRRFALDAFLFLCGALEPALLAQIRSGFAGHVTCVFIQPRDLLPVRGRLARSDDEALFARTLRSFAELPQTRAEVFHVVEPLVASVAEAADAGAPVRPLTVLDWTVTRPHLSTLERDGGKVAQLRKVTDAAGHLAAAVLVRALVPALAARAIPDPMDLGNLEYAQRPGVSDDVERAVADLLVRQIAQQGVYGFDGADLQWVLARGAGDAGADWLAPGEPLPGTCTWQLGLRGAEWQGRVHVPSGSGVAVAPLPTIVGCAADLQSWPRTRLPAAVLPPGPARWIELGGRVLGRRVSVWWRDGDVRRDFALRDALAAPDLAQVHSAAEVRIAGELRSLPCPQATHALWPAPSWPTALLAHAAELASTLGALRAHEVTDSHLDLYLGGEPLRLCVFPRHPDQHLVSGGALSLAYLGRQRHLFDAARLSALAEWLARWVPPGTQPHPSPLATRSSP